MPHRMNCTWRCITVGALALSALLIAQLTAFSAEPATTPTFTKDIAPIFQAKCESCHRARFDCTDVARDLRRNATLRTRRSRIESLPVRCLHGTSTRRSAFRSSRMIGR